VEEAAGSVEIEEEGENGPRYDKCSGIVTGDFGSACGLRTIFSTEIR